jgi:nucleoside-diphosphate-sugar epimerase
MKALVTGGGGFLGGAIVRRLVERGDQVRTLQRGSYAALDELGVEQVRADIADAEPVAEAVAGCDVVFHVAGKVEMWGPYEPFHRVNVLGTQNVLDAMRRHSVGKLVFTSTPSVIHRNEDLAGVDESEPYPEHYEAAYAESKAEAERTVLAANDENLATVALRPRLIWGPGDTQLFPRIVERARAGTLRFVGDGSNLIDTTYIDNAAEAHLLAADRLEPGAACAGRVYFISNGEPRPMKEIVNGMLEVAGVPPLERSVPVWLGLTMGSVFETAHRLLPGSGEPRMTRMIASNFAATRWFDISAARRDLGYEPAVSIDEGFERLRRWFEESGGR